MAKFSTVKDGNIEYSFWLILDRNGNVRLTRGRPDIGRDERRISMSAKLPLSLFREPELSASITIPAADAPKFQIDIEAAREALEMALGVDVEMSIRPNPGGSDGNA